MADTRRPLSSEMTGALEHLGRLSLRDLSMEDLLQDVARLSRSVTPGAPEASVTILVRDKPSTVASTGTLANRLDERQYEQDAGPCLHAARSGEVTEMADARTETRWPDYAPRAVEEGCLSSLSLPLAVDDEQITGALNVYARTSDAFDDTSRSAGISFASYAAVAAGKPARRPQRQGDRGQPAGRAGGPGRHRPGQGHPHGALQDHRRPGLPDAGAASMTANTKVREVADHLVGTGELPTIRRRRR